MRTQKGFTADVLDRFIREGRGQGIYEDYSGWHRVSRGDPASSGRSHLLRWQGRLLDLMSDGEFRTQLFIQMLPDLEDVLEQLPLDHLASHHPSTWYSPGADQHLYPGTQDIADDLQLKHPSCFGKSRRSTGSNHVLWTMSTDVLVVTRSASGGRRFIALAVKPQLNQLNDRKTELLMIEREYWAARGIPWLLITGELYSKAVGLCLTRTCAWALRPPVRQEHIEIAAAHATSLQGESITAVLMAIAAELRSLEAAQDSLWQAIWSGRCPVSLDMGWRPHLPLRPLSSEAFWAQNPVASMRSAWT